MRIAVTSLFGSVLLAGISVPVRQGGYGLTADILLGAGTVWLAAVLVCLFFRADPLARLRRTRR